MFNSAESVEVARSPAMAKRGRPAKKRAHEEIPGQSARLRRLREAYGHPTAASFAAFLGIPVTTYNSFENGAPLSRQAIFKIVGKIPGVTSDWLWFDNAQTMPYEVLRRLGLLGNEKT